MSSIYNTDVPTATASLTFATTTTSITTNVVYTSSYVDYILLLLLLLPMILCMLLISIHSRTTARIKTTLIDVYALIHIFMFI